MKKVLFIIFGFLLFANIQAQVIFSTDSKYTADISVYVVDSKYTADLLIYFVDSKYNTGWKDKSKKHLLF